MGGFANPFLLWGAALVAVPIVIHLLNRRRYQTVPWAAMSFLLAAHRRNRRRVRTENLLLLLLRCLGVLLLAFAIARPFLESQPPQVATLEKRKDAILVMDLSYSMGLRDGIDSPLQRGVQAAMGILDGLKSERGDQVTVLAAKSRPQILSWKKIDSAREILRSLESPSFEANRFSSTMEWVRRAAEDLGEGGDLVVYWISDLQKSSLAENSAEPGKSTAEGKGLASLFSSLADRGAKLQIVDVGPSSMRPANLGVVSLTPEETASEFAGAPVVFRARVRNYGGADRNGVRVFLDQDGTRFASQTLDIPSGQERDAVFSVPLLEPGSHWIGASTEEDALPADDVRFHAIWARPPAKLLLVDGNPSIEDPTLSETWALREYFPPGQGEEDLSARLPFHVEVLDRSRFFSNLDNLLSFDLCVLANVEGFPEGGVARIESYVRAGGTVLFLLGDRIEAGYYNAALRSGSPEKSLLPGQLLARQAVSSRRTEYYRIAYPDFDHPALKTFQDPQWKPLLTEVPVYEFWRLTPDPTGSGAKILASLDDTDRSPFLLERSLGKGRSAVLASPISSSWNRLAESPKTFFPLFFELFRYLTAGESKERDLLVLDSIPLRNARFPRKVSWIDSTGSRRNIDATPQNAEKESGGEMYVLPPITETQRPGVYATEMEIASGASGTTTEKTYFAVNVEPKEGDLERLTAEMVPGFFPGMAVAWSAGGDSAPAAPAQPKDRGEIWTELVIAGISILALESLLAAWFGRRRVEKGALPETKTLEKVS